MIAPDGIIRKLTSLEELQIGAAVDDNSWRQFAEDVGYLRQIRVLRTNVVSWKEPLAADAMKWRSVTLSHLRHLSLLPDVELPEMPPFIHPSRVPNLSHLDIYVSTIDEQGLKSLGGLPELSYLKLQMSSTATLTITAADGCFQKLTSCLLPYSMVQFVLREDSSGVPFTLWDGFGTMTFGCKREDECRVAPAVMPNLQHLEFMVQVRALLCNKSSRHNLGLEYLPSLRKVDVHFDCCDAYILDVEQEESALKNVIEVHPNRPTLDLDRWFEDRMKCYDTKDDVHGRR